MNPLMITITEVLMQAGEQALGIKYEKDNYFHITSLFVCMQ
jgi:hypothetical protein